jgi:peptidoglycan hydrolase-like protein with peptidoglycan-binding domain
MHTTNFRVLRLMSFIVVLTITAPFYTPVTWAAASKGSSAAWPAPKVPAMVRALQYLLRAHGFEVNVDGIFGRQTRREVMNFQRSRRLKVDGIVGSQTWRALVVQVKRGDKGEAVRAVQTLCFSEVHDVRENGIFDAATEDWVRDFQKYESLKVDGIVGPYTWKRLLQSQFENPYD